MSEGFRRSHPNPKCNASVRRKLSFNKGRALKQRLQHSIYAAAAGGRADVLANEYRINRQGMAQVSK